MVMAAAPHPSLLVSLGVGALLAWRMYSRMRRMVGRQSFSRNRAIATSVFFPLLLVLVLPALLAHPASLLSLAGGAGVGIALGIYGLRRTKFEITSIGLFYTPSAHLGVALSLLLVGRVVLRLVQIYAYGAQPSSQAAFATSPITLAILGTIAGYYVSYAIGLLKRAP